MSEVFEVNRPRSSDKNEYYSYSDSERPVVLRVPVEKVEVTLGSLSNLSILPTLPDPR